MFTNFTWKSILNIFAVTTDTKFAGQLLNFSYKNFLHQKKLLKNLCTYCRLYDKFTNLNCFVKRAEKIFFNNANSQVSLITGLTLCFCVIQFCVI